MWYLMVLNEFLNRYAQSGTIRAHMPGHKGKVSPFDITEIKGADSLYDADGIIAESEKRTSELFGSYKTLYSCGGSTLCIQTMAAVVQKAKGSRFLAVRNCHRAFLSAAVMTELDVEWIYPEYSGSYVSGKVDPAIIEKALSEHPDTAAVYITSPDYLGVMADIRAISDICHSYGAVLMVDNAHGAYLRFMYDENGKCLHPNHLGADIVCDSAHKTLPVLTGGAYLHINDPSLELYDGFAKHIMSVFGSSSPSYLMMQSMDSIPDSDLDAYFSEMRENTRALKASLGRRYRFTGDEDGKISIYAPFSGYTGNELAELLRGHGIECEYSDDMHVVMMVTGLDKEQIERIGKVLSELPQKPGSTPGSEFEPYGHEIKMSARDAFLSPFERIPTEMAEGRICAFPVTLCPPGIALITSGEVFCGNDIFFLKKYGILFVNVVK